MKKWPAVYHDGSCSNALSNSSWSDYEIASELSAPFHSSYSWLFSLELWAMSYCKRGIRKRIRNGIPYLTWSVYVRFLFSSLRLRVAISRVSSFIAHSLAEKFHELHPDICRNFDTNLGICEPSPTWWFLRLPIASFQCKHNLIPPQGTYLAQVLVDKEVTQKLFENPEA